MHNAWITLIFTDKSGVNCVDKCVDRVDCIYTSTNAANTENSDVIITIINNSSVVFLISKMPVT